MEQWKVFLNKKYKIGNTSFFLKKEPAIIKEKIEKYNFDLKIL